MPVLMIPFEGSVTKLRIEPRPFDLTYDNLEIPVIAPATTDLVFRVNGEIRKPVEVKPCRLDHANSADRWHRHTISIDLRNDYNLGARSPIVLQVDQANDEGGHVLIADSLITDSMFASRFIRHSIVNQRQLTYFLQFAAILTVLLAIVLLLSNFVIQDASDIAVWSQLLIALFPTLGAVYADYFGGSRLRAVNTRNLFCILLRYRLAAFAAATITVFLASVEYHAIRCNLIESSYKHTLAELADAFTQDSDPSVVQTLGKLISIAPERRENLELVQRMLWIHRHGDISAKVVEGEPQGFLREQIALSLEEYLEPDVRTSLALGQAPTSCGCVSAQSSIDPRLLWIALQEEQVGYTEERSLPKVEALISYLDNLPESVGDEFKGLKIRHRLLEASYKQQSRNIPYEKAMSDLEVFLQGQPDILPAYWEIFTDLYAQAKFTGYCEVEVGIAAMEQILDKREREPTKRREFPPEKLILYRYFDVITTDSEDKLDYFSKKASDTLDQDWCDPEKKTLRQIFEERIVERYKKFSLPENWRIGTSAADDFFRITLKNAQQGWQNIPYVN